MKAILFVKLLPLNSLLIIISIYSNYFDIE